MAEFILQESVGDVIPLTRLLGFEQLYQDATLVSGHAVPKAHHHLEESGCLFIEVKYRKLSVPERLDGSDGADIQVEAGNLTEKSHPHHVERRRTVAFLQKPLESCVAGVFEFLALHGRWRSVWPQISTL